MTVRSNSLLVVDDNQTNCDLLAEHLRYGGFEVATAADGARALELIRARSFDLVLLDIMMPGPDGLEVLKILRQAYTPTDLPIIMVTGRDDSHDVVRALELGANDYVTKPLDVLVVLARVQTHLSLKRAMEQVKDLSRSLARQNKALEAANSRMSRDLRAAAKIQQAFLPRPAPDLPGASFAWAFRPCDELAGDGLNIIPLDGGRVGLYVLDVSGHGVPAALLSVSLARFLSPPPDPASILAGPGEGQNQSLPLPPAEVIGRLNHLFPFDPATEQFSTMVYGILDTAAREFRYTSAGHPGPIHLPKGGAAELLDGRGRPIGLATDTYHERSVRLGPGDRLYLYSDGIPDAADREGNRFGKTRLLESLQRGQEKPLADSVADLVEEIRRWRSGATARDDVSLLGVEIGP